MYEKINYSSSEPITVEDEYGNKYFCLNTYEAQAIAWLLQKIERGDFENLDTGDWYHQLPVRLTKWLEGDSNAKTKKDDKKRTRRSY